MEAGMRQFGEIMVSELKRGLSQSNLIASRKTLSSLRYEIDKSRSGIYSMNFWSRSKGNWDVFFVIDKGAKPNSPPPTTDIEKWMRQKNIQPRRKGRFVKSTDANIRRSAYAISQSIHEKGIIKRFNRKGARIFDKVTAKNKGIFEETVLGGLERDINRIIKNKN